MPPVNLATGLQDAFKRFIYTLFFAYMASFYATIQVFQLQFYSISPSQDLVFLLHPNIDQKLHSLFLKYKVPHSTTWSECPCIRLATATP